MRIYDYHEHDGAEHNLAHTHEHDNHGRHHHDRGGSIYYYRTDDGAPAPVPIVRKSDPVGVGGFDVRWSDHHSRTSRAGAAADGG